MSPTTPPPPPPTKRAPLSKRLELPTGLALFVVFLVCTLVFLRAFGLLRTFSVPTGSMTPAVSAGDYVIMEGMTFLARKPRYGDVVVYKSDRVGSLTAGSLYIKRVAGVPGDRVSISDGKLFINHEHVSLSNSVGEIVYYQPQMDTPQPKTGVLVPDNCYFLLGDNSINSLDSRYFGPVSRDRIIGRIFFCYWPPRRVGAVK
jgi:signal peptidase I